MVNPQFLIHMSCIYLGNKFAEMFLLMLGWGFCFFVQFVCVVTTELISVSLKNRNFLPIIIYVILTVEQYSSHTFLQHSHNIK